MPETWDYETDVLVIGYGGAGLWAGITAFDEGAQVLYLEKSPFRGGGSSSINMGQWTAPHDADAAAQFAFEAFHGQTPMEVCQAWAEEAVQNPDYADEYGLEYTLGDSPRAEYNIFTGYEEMYVGSGDGYGAGFFEAMDQHRADRGIEVLFECHDEELIQNPVTKEIVGCYTLMGTDETPKAVKASKGVILCTGGFEFNEELQAKYLKCYPMRGFYGWKYNTGDGITMAQKVGADLWHMQQVCGGDDAWFDDPEIVPGGVSVQSPTPNYIKVSRLGERWGNEEIFSPHGGWKPYANFDEEICDFDRIPSWYIFDQTSFDGGSWGGMVGGAATENGGMGIGYILTMLLMSSIREIIGSGTWLGITIIPESVDRMTVMNSAPGGFFVFGCLMAGCVWLERKLNKPIERKSCGDVMLEKIDAAKEEQKEGAAQ